MDIVQDEMSAFSCRRTEDVVEAIWTGHPVLGADFTVRVHFVRNEDGWKYDFGFSGLGMCAPMRIEAIDFPVLSAHHSPKAGILFSRPHGMGVVRRPDWGRHPQQVALEESEPRGFQFAAILDETGESWYVDARDDGARHYKKVFARKSDASGKSVTVGFRWWVPDTVTREGRLPWNGFLTRFRGGWYEASQIYRAWARTTGTYRRAVARGKGGHGGRLRDVAFWAWNRGVSRDVLPPLERFAADAGVPVALDWYWWHKHTYDTGYPDFWPPREGVESFVSAVRGLRKKGVYAMVYTNGYGWDMDDPSWSEGESGVRMDHNVEYNGAHWNQFAQGRHRLAYLCGEAAEHQRRMREVVRTLSGTGLNGVYLDQISCCAGEPCWNPAHRHAKGGGAETTDGYRAYVQAVRTENPGLDLSSEEASEKFLDCFNSFISLFGPAYERCWVGTCPEYEAVPVWNAIYHEAVTCFGSYSLLDGIPPWDDRWPAEKRWPEEKDWTRLYPDQFAVEFARGVVWGNQPGTHCLRLEHATDPRYAADYRFMVDTARFYHAHRDWLYDGEMLNPGRMACAGQDVEFVRRNVYSKAGAFDTVTSRGLPSVLHSVWRAPDGRIAAILVNWTRRPQSWTLEGTVVGGSGELPPRTWSVVLEKGR